MKKTYEAPHTIISDLHLIHGNKRFRVSFNPISVYSGSGTGHGSMLVTSDPDLQAAIESSNLFHRSIFIFKEEQEAKPVEQKTEVNYKVVNVDSPADARDYLQENYGIDKKRILNLKQIKIAAEKVGVVFEGL